MPAPPTPQGLPFRGLAEKIGDIVMPAMKVSRIRSRRDLMTSAVAVFARITNQQRAQHPIFEIKSIQTTSHPPSIRQAAREQKRAAAAELRRTGGPQVPMPAVPAVLPFTHWAANSDRVRATLVDDKATRPKARLSWYHPDDTMVPRDWFRSGLLEDLKYYRPFAKPAQA